MKKRKIVLEMAAVAAAALTAATASASLHRTSPVAGEPVVRDTDTGLMWQGCPSGTSGDNCGTGGSSSMSWQAALAYCNALDWGGYDDWRLPDRNELQSIVDYKKENPSIDTTAFPGTPSLSFWSSTSYALASDFAWNVSFFGMSSVSRLGKSKGSHARCVRVGVGP